MDTAKRNMNTGLSFAFNVRDSASWKIMHWGH